MEIIEASNLILKDIPENERYNFTMHGGCYVYAKSLQILCDDITLYINKDRKQINGYLKAKVEKRLIINKHKGIWGGIMEVF